MALKSCEIDELVSSMAIGDSEDDTLSTTSTIDYCYKEEFSSKDDEEDAIPTEENTDEESPSVLSRMVSQWFDDWPVSDKKLEQLIDSCKVSGSRELERTWISVYAYFNKKKHHGGYGLIVRGTLGEPIIASAQFSKVGCSFYYQLFKGINAGIKLAEQHGRSHLHVMSNSLKLPSFCNHLYFCPNKCRNTADANSICEECDRFIMVELGCDMLPAKHLVLNLRHKEPINVQTERGISEHYLAKLEKKNVLEAQNKEGRYGATDEDGSGETGHVIQLADLPQRIKHIIWGEGFDMSNSVYSYYD